MVPEQEEGEGLTGSTGSGQGEAPVTRHTFPSRHSVLYQKQFMYEENLPQTTPCLVRLLALHFLDGLIRVIPRLVQVFALKSWLQAHGRDFLPTSGEPVRVPLPAACLQSWTRRGAEARQSQTGAHLAESMCAANTACSLLQ